MRRNNRFLESRKVTFKEIEACRSLVDTIQESSSRSDAFQQEKTWTSVAGDQVYGTISKVDAGCIDEKFLNELRLHSFIFSGWHLQNLIAADPYPSWTDAVKEEFCRGGEKSEIAWNTKAFRELISSIPENLIFNPPLVCGELGYDIDGYCVNRDTILCQYRINTMYYLGVIDHLEKQEKPILLEIGAGLGSLAYFLKKIIPQLTYLVIDIPHSLMFSGCYLSIAQNDAPVVFATTAEDLVPEAINLVLSSNYMKVLDDINLDLALNTMSFAEMPEEIVQNYGAFVKKRLRPNGFLFEQNFNCELEGRNFCNPKAVLSMIFDSRQDLSRYQPRYQLTGHPSIWW